MKYVWHVFAAGLLGALSGCTAPDRHTAAASTDGPEPTTTGGEPYHGVIQYRATDAKPAILEPEFVVADKTIIANGTKVIGVFIEGEARAYPLFILNNHQVVNDEVGGIPLSASW